MTQPPDSAARDARRGIPFVVMYHSVDHYQTDPHQITVSPARFRRQLRLLRWWGLRGVSMRELLRARAAGRAKRLVGLTFDDGYADFNGQVLPELRRHDFTATVFVVAGRIGGVNDWDEGPRKPLMSATAVRQAAAAGMEIGSHGWHHVHLSRLGAAQLAVEVAHSRRLLGELTGAEITGFCYPYGDRDQAATDAVRKAGYRYACATWASGDRDEHALPRTYLGERDGAARLLAKRFRHHLTWREIRA